MIFCVTHQLNFSAHLRCRVLESFRVDKIKRQFNRIWRGKWIIVWLWLKRQIKNISFNNMIYCIFISRISGFCLTARDCESDPRPVFLYFLKLRNMSPSLTVWITDIFDTSTSPPQPIISNISTQLVVHK